ncbi:hypothetical protein ACP4OV_023756 [Aristida adscensionis]
MAFLVLLLLSALVVHVLGQPGFLSIDCGLDAKVDGYTDDDTKIYYVPDGAYTDAGESLEVSAEYKKRQHWPRLYTTVRSFPSGERNCYALPTAAGAKYLLRLEACYGNHDGENDSSSLEFELNLGSQYWDTVSFVSGEQPSVREVVFVAWASWAPACLVDIGRGAPFVSVLELRRLDGALYPPLMASQAMATFARENMGPSGIEITRYPDDPYDRYWWMTTDPQWANLSTAQVIPPNPGFMEPLPVLQTAIAAAGNSSTTLSYPWQKHSSACPFMVFLHFSDFQNAQLRQFDIYLNGNRLRPAGEKAVSPPYLAASCVYSSGWYRAPDGAYNLTLVATAASVLPPMLNAIEIYYLVAFDRPMTFPKDLNLSNSNLGGRISKNFTLLTALENLDLSSNDFRGSIPDSLPSLPSLRVLNLSGNHLSGDSLCKNYTKMLFRFDADGHECDKRISQTINRAAVIAISVVIPILVLAILLAYFIWRQKRKNNISTHYPACDLQLENTLGSRKSHGDPLQNTENRYFTYKELEKLTSNFKRFIGQGGFGLVYYGRLGDGSEVAVKMRSESSTHGLDEFLAEVQSLTKVHHRNLVSLLGYCWEEDHLALVYEYISKGSLCDHLRGKPDVAENLVWGTRVRIVLEAAQGLDYLHKGCSLPIIHCDVKSSNILLGQNLKAKIADFGLCKTYLSDTQTHISVTPAGTAGYIDPEYYHTGRLTESSDVYSFGVVLLEVATGEPPVVPGHGHIAQRVKQIVATGDISSVADARLQGAYNVSSMWKVVETAMMCTADAVHRPTMSAVVAQLKESLALEEEEAWEMECSVPGSRARDSEALMSTLGPLAR